MRMGCMILNENDVETQNRQAREDQAEKTGRCMDCGTMVEFKGNIRCYPCGDIFGELWEKELAKPDRDLRNMYTGESQ